MDELVYKRDYAGITVEQVEYRRQRWYKTSASSDLMPSVTTVLKTTEQSGALVGWASKDAYERVAAQIVEDMGEARLPLAPLSEEEAREFTAELTRRAKARSRTGETAAQFGTRVHDTIDQILFGKREEWDVAPDIQHCIDLALAFLRNERLTPVRGEHAIWHPTSKYAGTIDLIVRDADARVHVVDWKTSRELQDSYDWQASAYARALGELIESPVAGAFVVRLPRDRSNVYAFRRVDIARGGAMFDSIHGIWRSQRAYAGERDMEELGAA